jgi:sulfatase modifying factor 1
MAENQDDNPDTSKGCCAGSRGGSARLAVPAITRVASRAFRDDLMATLSGIPGGFFDMGARKPRYPADFEGPRRKVFVSPFRIGRTSVTNAMFARFVAEAGYRTVAETEGWSYVFHLFLDKPEDYPRSPPGTPWWRQVHGACWSAPEGPGSSIEGRENHPVVHVAWYDAMAFCDFAGVRLPTEAEWEKAARGGLAHKRFPWGNELEPASGHRHNVWQGVFPTLNTTEDGYAGTCPADAFPPNGFGLHNMTGNVWEWCSDWFDKPPETRLPPRDPRGPETGGEKVVRGGSHLCHASYCERYHVHSRTKNTPDSSTGHMGFRVAADI